jgi:replicative superfamily II helicase
VGAPSSSDLLTIAELAIFSELQDEEGGKILYLAPKALICKNVYQNWKRRMSQDLGLEVAMIDETQTVAQ